MKDYERYFNAVDVVCGECYGNEEDCEKCPVRKCADVYWNDYRNGIKED